MSFLPTIAVLVGSAVTTIVMAIIGGPFVGATLGGSFLSLGTAVLQSRTERRLTRELTPRARPGTDGRDGYRVEHERLAPGIYRITCTACGPVNDTPTQRLAQKAVRRHRHDHQTGQHHDRNDQP